MRGDEADAQRQRRELQAAVLLHQAGGGEGGESLLPPPRQQAEGEQRVHLAHGHLQASARRIELDGGEAAHRHPLGQLLAALAQLAMEALQVGAPDDRFELADDLVAVPLLHQLEVEVPVAARPQPLHLAHHPDAGEGLAEEGAHLLPQLRDGVRLQGERELFHCHTITLATTGWVVAPPAPRGGRGRGDRGGARPRGGGWVGGGSALRARGGLSRRRAARPRSRAGSPPPTPSPRAR